MKALFEKAVQYYEQNMIRMLEIGDRAAQGRACGNLGNVHYLLGNFPRAIHYHTERLNIATEFEVGKILKIVLRHWLFVLFCILEIFGLENAYMFRQADTTHMRLTRN